MYTVKYRQGRRTSGTARRRRFSGASSNNRNASGRHGSGRGGRQKGGHNHRAGRSGYRNRYQQRGGRRMPTFDPTQFINKNPVSTADGTYVPRHTFANFGLGARLVEAITRMGITTPTPIQDTIIPEILLGRDVIGLAETGTGKTAAFLVPIIEKTLADKKRQALILAPTRELAIQIERELRELSRGMGLFSVVCVGGANINPQIRVLRKTNHFIIGTPGRLLDLLNRNVLKLGYITTVVLDEADRMLDMGFIHDIRKLLVSIPKQRETLLFSATMSGATEKLVKEFLRDPVTVSVKKKDVIDSIAQDIVSYEHHTKFETLVNLLKQPAYQRVLVFGAMKHSVEKLARQLSASGISATSIHGNKNHTQRQRALASFKNGEVRVLVATDVAARGIHVDNITHVINYDLPNTREDYIHRIGRTGRATKKGQALSFVHAR